MGHPLVPLLPNLDLVGSLQVELLLNLGLVGKLQVELLLNLLTFRLHLKNNPVPLLGKLVHLRL